MSKKVFIQDLYKKRSDFKDLDQAEMLSNLLDTVSSDIYSESQRFIFELIQNADDAAETELNEIHFDFYPNHLIVSHNGKPFDEKDILSITHAGKGTKSADLTKTGYKGIGFKSVFGKSNWVAILSDGYNFRFDKKFIQMAFNGNKMPWQIIPIWTSESDLDEAIKAEGFENKFKVSTIIELENTSNLKKELYELLSKGKILLFLRKISKVKIYSKGILENQIEKQQQKSETSFTEVKLVQNEKELSSWIVTTFGKIPIDEKTQLELKQDEKTPNKLKEAKYTEISFAAKIENGNLRGITGEESLIFAYLPTKVNAFGFPFLVNTSFLTNASREGIHEDRIWNQWLFKLLGEKIFDWLGLLSQSKFKFQILHLLPSKFSSSINELKLTFNNAYEIHGRNKPFILNKSSQLKKAPEILIDNTGLSEQDFIPTEAIIEYINRETGKKYSVSSLVHQKLELKTKLNSLGAYTFDLVNLEEFFIDDIFKTNHQPSQNFSLIKYFFEKAYNSSNKELNEKLKTIPFIYAKGKKLKSPQTVCFPSLSFETETGLSVSVIHSEVYPKIESEPNVKSWLELLGVKEPSDIAYIENELIGNIEKCITKENYINVTCYLFNKYKKNILTEWHLIRLGDLKLLTNNKEFVEAKNCYLSDFYEPVLKLEKILVDGKYVSQEYKRKGDLISEWKTFFLKIGVSENIKPVRIERKDSAILVNRFKVDFQYIVDFFKVPGYDYSYDTYSITILPLMEKIHNYKVSKLFWKSIFSNVAEIYKLTEETRGFWGFSDMGGQKHGNFIQSYFEWTIKNKECIPATNKKVFKSIDLFINHDEIKEIAGPYLPVLDCDIIPDEDFQKLLNFRTKLEIEDYLKIIEAIGNDTVNDEELKVVNKKRVGLIYIKLTSLIPNLSAKRKNIISEWARFNKLLCDNGKFENATELKWVKIDGFKNTSDQLKLVFIPENCATKKGELQELLKIFGVQIIDSFNPDIKDKELNTSLKIQLQGILPFFTAILERKHYLDYSVEFMRLSKIVDNTEFYNASEIILSFKNQNEEILGPSLHAYLDKRELSFKGNWKTPITFYALIPEILRLLGLTGLNEELGLLLQLDENGILEWLYSQGYEPEKIMEKDEYKINKVKLEALESNSKGDSAIQSNLKSNNLIESIQILLKRKNISLEQLIILIERFDNQNEEPQQGFGSSNDLDQGAQIEENEKARMYVMERLLGENFEFTQGIGKNSVVNGVFKNGVEYPLVVKSYKDSNYKFNINPNEWLQLSKPNAMFWVHRGGGRLEYLELKGLLRENSEFFVRFETDTFSFDGLVSFASAFRFVRNVHFQLDAPNFSSARALNDYRFYDRNTEENLEGGDDASLLR